MFALAVASRRGRGEWPGGGGGTMRFSIGQHWNNLGTYTHKGILPVNIIINNLQMGNMLLHVLFPYNVSNITQDFKKTALILKPHSGPVDAVKRAGIIHKKRLLVHGKPLKVIQEYPKM